MMIDKNTHSVKQVGNVDIPQSSSTRMNVDHLESSSSAASIDIPESYSRRDSKVARKRAKLKKHEKKDMAARRNLGIEVIGNIQKYIIDYYILNFILSIKCLIC